MSLQQSKPKTIRLDSTVINKVEKMAEIENRNFSNMVETILKKATEDLSL